MKDRIGRNDPCPCGSGRKYKKCCMYNKNNSTFSPKYQFKPGTYGDIGNFMPSIACLKQTPANDWKYHSVLVKPSEIHNVEKNAFDEALEDLSVAFEEKEKTGSDFSVAEVLKAKGYFNVEDFRIVSD